MEMKIEKLPGYKIRYFRKVGAYGIDNMQIMEKIKDYAKSCKLFCDQSLFFGVIHDNPVLTAPENCRYDACIVVNDEKLMDNTINSGFIDEGNYAVFLIGHTAESIQKAWMEIFPDMNKRGYKYDETRPILERYSVEMIKKHLCEICIPVKQVIL